MRCASSCSIAYQRRARLRRIISVSNSRIPRAASVFHHLLKVANRPLRGDLTVDPHTDYEAWHVVGPGGLPIVCTPGGKLATGRRSSCPADDDP
uniref:DUF6188 family protein n=1 Tax=Streptomyces asoensis TaxID=249586 RepID=UPI00345F6139